MLIWRIIWIFQRLAAHKIRGILSISNDNTFVGYLTSSPTSTNSDSRTPSISNFDPSTNTNHNNFNSSNIEAPGRPFFNRGSSSVESSPIVKHASNVGTPVGGVVRRHELSFSSVDVSPIGGGGSTFDDGKDDFNSFLIIKIYFIFGIDSLFC